jgi:hypothetical protein
MLLAAPGSVLHEPCGPETLDRTWPRVVPARRNSASPARRILRSPSRVPDSKCFDVRAQPQAHFAPWQLDDRYREVGIAPGIDRHTAGLGKTQKLRDFDCADEVLGVNDWGHW